MANNTFSFNTWLAAYCAANSVRPLAVEAAARALVITYKLADTADAWMGKYLANPSAAERAVVKALWQELQPAVPLPEVEAVPPPIAETTESFVEEATAVEVLGGGASDEAEPGEAELGRLFPPKKRGKRRSKSK